MTKVERVVAPTNGSCIWSFEEKVIDRSIGCCGDASEVVVWPASTTNTT